MPHDPNIMKVIELSNASLAPIQADDESKSSSNLLPCHKELIDLARALGRPQFPQFLWSVIDSRVPIDSMELCCYTRNAAHSRMINIEWLGTASGPEYPDIDLEEEAKIYLERHWHLDPLKPLILQLEGVIGHRITIDQIETDEARHEWFGGGRVPEHYAICEAFGDFIYVLYTMRTDKRPQFSDHELSILHQMAEYMLPLVRSHAEIVPARLSIVGHNPTLRKHLCRRLEKSEVVISQREFDVCLAVLSGKTLAQMSDDLGLQATSVKTYLSRALEKIGVRTKGELFSWCFSSPNP